MFVIAMALVVALCIDMAVATAISASKLPPQISRLVSEGLEICETFGHGFGATLIVIAVVILDPSKRQFIGWLLGGSWGAGMVANSLKYLLPRIRPRDFEDLGSGPVWETFNKGRHTGWGMQSFPSAHTATAVGLAVMLAAMYPRGRWYFVTLAVLVGIQRIAVSAHFPSDVIAGAVVGWIVGTVCTRPKMLPSEGN
jgi:membrane-associated phospholipid phosphatase